MSEADLYVTLDQGGHASRAILFDRRGEARGQAYVPINTRHSVEGYVEHDADEIVESLRTAATDLIEQTSGNIGRRAGRDSGPGKGVGGRHEYVPVGSDKNIPVFDSPRPPSPARNHACESTSGISSTPTLVAVGLATQRSSIVCWNRSTGAALSPVISWQDRRNAALVESLQSHAERVHRLTGLVLSPHYGASKLRWCLDHLPQVAQAAANGELAFGPLSSFVLFRLLSERPLVVDPANASRTQLWNPKTREWEPELLKLFGVPAQHLPQPVTSRHAYGTLEIGDRRLPLTVCTGDQSAVPFAFGPARAGTIYVNFGTGAFIQCPLARRRKSTETAAPLLSSVLWSDDRTTLSALEGTVNGAGSALEWLAQQEGLETERMLQSLPATLDAGVQPPLFLNGISGLGSPFWIADFESRFLGRGTPQEKFVAILESILFLVRVNLDEMQQHGARPQRFVVTGGLAAADFLCRSLADLAHLPVTRYREREATARGLAFLTAGEPRDWATPPAEVFTPQLNTALRERYFAWLKAMKQAIGQK